VSIEKQRIEKEKQRSKQRDAKVLGKPVENQKQEIARQSIEKHEKNTGKAEEVRKTNNILSKRGMLKITQNRRSRIRNISRTTAYVNPFIKVALKNRCSGVKTQHE
jgi:hypothetical protein